MAWTREQLHNAQVIINVGRQLGASQRDIQIALMAAITESNLHNYSGGDRDSVGLFQQRDAWGSFAQRHNPAAAARMFFTGGHAGQRGLFDFANRDNMTMGQAAQAVQVSAYPDRYAEHTQQASNLLGAGAGASAGLGLGTGGGDPEGGGPVTHDFGQNKDEAKSAFQAASEFATQRETGLEPDWMRPAVEQTNSGTAGVGHYAAPMALADLPDDSVMTMPSKFPGNAPGPGGGTGPGPGGSAWRQQIRQFAKKFLGTPYVWGGTSPQGFDCSGFVQYVYKHALGIDLPRISADQARAGHRISLDDLRVGDLVGWDNSSRNNGADHIAIYIGNGRIIEAPRPGLSVQISNLYDQNIAWGVRMRR